MLTFPNVDIYRRLISKVDFTFKENWRRRCFITGGFSFVSFYFYSERNCEIKDPPVSSTRDHPSPPGGTLFLEKFEKKNPRKNPQHLHFECKKSPNDTKRRKQKGKGVGCQQKRAGVTPHDSARSTSVPSLSVETPKNLLLCSVCLSVVNKKRQNCPHQLLKLSIWLAPLGSIIFKFFKSTEMSPKLNRWIIG